MKKIIAATFIVFATGSQSIFLAEKAQACSDKQQNPANHPTAYSDGYKQGVESVRKGHNYRPRTAGGEFGRGFEDGYYKRPYKGQQFNSPYVQCSNFDLFPSTTSIPNIHIPSFIDIPKIPEIPKDIQNPSPIVPSFTDIPNIPEIPELPKEFLNEIEKNRNLPNQ